MLFIKVKDPSFKDLGLGILIIRFIIKDPLKDSFKGHRSSVVETGLER